MDTMPLNVWTKYKDLLAKISNEASSEFSYAVFNKNGLFKGVGLGGVPRDDLIDYAYALVTKYSEASTEAACIFYDELAELSGKFYPPAVPAETASISEVGKTINGTIANTNGSPEVVAASISRLVKLAGQDTTLNNAIRDGAEFAWIPAGDTCAFCITLASRGWQRASKKAMKKGHAEHIHGNCDCAYAVRFDGKMKYAGYDPEKYLDMYNSHSGTPKQKINAMRREAYAENKDEINAQKRSAYAKRQELNSSAAEEIDVS